jgi:hypothetical protein
MIFFIALLLSLLQTLAPPFKAQIIESNISIGYGLAVGDVDGDKKPDILLADKKQFVWYRNGDWKRFVMIDSLTQYDNVCIAARDLDGDGKVEVAVGAQWNPAETGNEEASGSVHYLVRPQDPTGLWKAVKLYHEPTIHRMRWARTADGSFYLAVLPLHGKGNQQGAGEGVKVLVYRYPDLLTSTKPAAMLPTGMHLTHNFAVVEEGEVGKEGLYVGGKEGVRYFSLNRLPSARPEALPLQTKGIGEIKMGKGSSSQNFVVTIEAMHGQEVVAYALGEKGQRVVIDSNVKEGHALAVADFLGTGSDQVIAGWRVPNKEGKVGIKLYQKKDASAPWVGEWIDENGMACEDIQVADLNGDGKLDIIASGRNTHNLKIYWNQSER